MLQKDISFFMGWKTANPVLKINSNGLMCKNKLRSLGNSEERLPCCQNARKWEEHLTSHLL